MLITFSGLDGAGKTTLINMLKGTLEERGCRVVIHTMYDDVSFYSLLRTFRDRARALLGMGAPNGALPMPMTAPTVSRPENPRDPKLAVTDKKSAAGRVLYRMVRSRALKRLVLLMDVACLWGYRCVEEKMRGRVLITDRYLYDSLADVADLDNRRWGFIRWFLRLVPTPDAPIFVDTPAEQAFARKPEYPLDYLQWRQGAYQRIFQWVHRPIILVNTDLAQTRVHVVTAVFERLAQHAKSPS